jgi:hypothetical protein
LTSGIIFNAQLPATSGAFEPDGHAIAPFIRLERSRLFPKLRQVGSQKANPETLPGQQPRCFLIDNQQSDESDARHQGKNAKDNSRTSAVDLDGQLKNAYGRSDNYREESQP